MSLHQKTRINTPLLCGSSGCRSVRNNLFDFLSVLTIKQESLKRVITRLMPIDPSEVVSLWKQLTNYD